MKLTARILTVLFISLTALILFFTSDICAQSAESDSGNRVYVYVHGYDGVLAEGEVYAFTFQSAIQRLDEYSGSALDIVFDYSDGQSSVYSVNGIANGVFSGNDGWHAYIQRGGRAVKPSDCLDSYLVTGDKVILYYGDAVNTKIISDLRRGVSGSKLEFSAVLESSVWSEERDRMVNRLEYISGANIRLFTPGGALKLLKTDSLGRAVTRTEDLGVYRYYAEGYVSDSYPNIVRTEDTYFVCGVGDENAVTRGEAAAFIVNHFNVKPGSTVNRMSDVGLMTPHQGEIITAVRAGLVSGYGDGTFRGEERISLLQFTVMLARLYPAYEPTYYYDDFSELEAWAREYAARAYENGLLEGIELNWYGDVTSDMLLKIYMNM